MPTTITAPPAAARTTPLIPDTPTRYLAFALHSNHKRLLKLAKEASAPCSLKGAIGLLALEDAIAARGQVKPVTLVDWNRHSPRQIEHHDTKLLAERRYTLATRKKKHARVIYWAPTAEGRRVAAQVRANLTELLRRARTAEAMKTLAPTTPNQHR